MGRKGNFLFQMATAIAYAKRHGLEWTVPTTTNNPVWSPVYLPHLAHPNYDPTLPAIQLDEGPHCYQDIPFKEEWRDMNIVLVGYWQSEKYFKEYRQDILDLFGYSRGLKYAEHCSLHVRRGDFIQYPNINPLLPMEYYKCAIHNIHNKTGVCKFIIFSDDIPWCREEFANGDWGSGAEAYRFTYCEGNQHLNEVKDLKLMLTCAYNIICNSTFSWWGAWLNQNPNKVVISPHEDNWYGPGNKHLEMHDLIPPEWIRIKF